MAYAGHRGASGGDTPLQSTDYQEGDGGAALFYHRGLFTSLSLFAVTQTVSNKSEYLLTLQWPGNFRLEKKEQSPSNENNGKVQIQKTV